MPQLRLALAQGDPPVGDLGGNAAIVRQWTARAREAGAHLVAFPEMHLTGYPVEDLALRSSFVDASRATAEQLARDLDADGLGHLPGPGRQRPRPPPPRRRLPRQGGPGGAERRRAARRLRPEGRPAERRRRP